MTFTPLDSPKMQTHMFLKFQAHVKTTSDELLSMRFWRGHRELTITCKLHPVPP